MIFAYATWAVAAGLAAIILAIALSVCFLIGLAVYNATRPSAE